MKKNIFVLAVLGALTLLGGCKDPEPKPEPDPTTITETEIPEKITFKNAGILMGVGEEVLLSDLIVEEGINAAALDAVSLEAAVAKIEGGKLKTLAPGETVIRISQKEGFAELRLAVAKLSEPYHIKRKPFQNYIWNYTDSPKEITNGARRPILIDFWATWCGPCQTLSPIIDKLAADYDGKVAFLKVEIDNGSSPEFAILNAFYESSRSDMAGIMQDGGFALPTMVILSKDASQARVFVGVKSETQLKAVLDEYLK